MTTPSLQPRLTQFLSRSRFAALGYSAEDDVYCPDCLRFATGFAPGQIDTTGRPVQTLFLADTTVHEETCCNCHRKLTDILADRLEPTTFQVIRIVRDETTHVRKEPVGLLVLSPSQKGRLYLNFLEGDLVLDVATEEELRTTEPVADPTPPIIRRRGAHA
jgi:hypothetical protein